MPKALQRLLLGLLLLLPLAAPAADADYFIAAKANEQARLLQDWAAQPDPARVELLSALQQGRIAAGDTRKLRLNNRLRGLVDNALASHQLLSADSTVRLAAAQQL
ncbi:urea ABC transporter permease subunit UrtB, partial [Pseudomonas frederiksbergensis]|nr:urea ABC transporter permease subunit UrtB [Pseudomonas frederiksbergensis]